MDAEYEGGSRGELTLTGDTAALCVKPFPVPLCPPQIKHGLPGNEIRLPRWEADDWPPETWYSLRQVSFRQQKITKWSPEFFIYVVWSWESTATVLSNLTSECLVPDERMKHELKGMWNKVITNCQPIIRQERKTPAFRQITVKLQYSTKNANNAVTFCRVSDRRR